MNPIDMQDKNGKPKYKWLGNSKENIHKVPEGYFNHLPGLIQKRIIADRYPIRFNLLFKLLNVRTAMAISFVSLVVIIWVIVFQKQQYSKENIASRNSFNKSKLGDSVLLPEEPSLKANKYAQHEIIQQSEPKTPVIDKIETLKSPAMTHITEESLLAGIESEDIQQYLSKEELETEETYEDL